MTQLVPVTNIFDPTLIRHQSPADELTHLVRSGKPISEIPRHHDHNHSLTALHMTGGTTYTICLGRPYTAQQVANHELPEQMYDTDLITRRGWYLRELELRIAANLDNPVGRYLLQWDQAGWLFDDEHEMTRRVYKSMDAFERMDPGTCWHWNGDYRGKKPAVSFRGYHNVSVMRLLWTLHRKDELLDRTFRPRHNPAFNGDDSLWLTCVNPHHHDRAVPMKLKPDPSVHVYGTRGSGGYRFTWYANEAVVNDQGELEIRCHKCATPLSQPSQDALRRGEGKGMGYCPGCKRARKQNSMEPGRMPDIASARAASAVDYMDKFFELHDGHLGNNPALDVSDLDTETGKGVD